MKNKKASIIICGLVFLTFLGCAKNKLISEQELPVAARNFISTHANELKIVQIEKDVDFLDTEYKVLFDTGLTIKFDHKGNWKKIDAHSGTIPGHLISSKISTYISTEYPEYHAKEIERDHKKYEVKISNGFELIFDKDENFIKIDH